MKKNLLAVLLPVVAGVALSGTGFGLWVFNETVSAKSIGASMELQPAININNDMSVTLKVKNSETSDQLVDTKMIFDEEYKTSGSWTVTLTVSITYEQLIGKLANYETDHYVYSDPIYSAGQTELSNKLGRYQITIANTISESLTNSATNSNYIKLADPSASSISYPLNEFTSSTGSSNNVMLKHDYEFTFVPDAAYNAISTKDAYNKLKDAVKTGKITFTASFEEVPHSA